MILPLSGGGFGANAYLVSAAKAAVVDAGLDPLRVSETLTKYSITPSFFINTHCHFDHVGGLPQLVSRFPGAVVVLHELDAKAIREVDDGRVLSRLFNSPFPLFGVGRTVVDGDVLDLGGVGLEVLHTPGHTPGSICLYDRVDGVLFTGDTVFAEGVGRTDFAGGDAGALRESLERLVGFCEENGVEKIYPGHGPEGTPEDIRRTLQFYFQ